MSISLPEINVNHSGDYLAEFVAKNELDKPPFTAYRLRDLRNRPKRRELFTGFMHELDICMLFAPPGAGKTFVALDMAACGVAGIPFARNFDVHQKLTVCYFAGEGVPGLVVRLDAIFEARGLSLDDEDRFIIFDDVPQLYAPTGNGAPELVTAIRDLGIAPDLVIIDTQHAATTGSDENGNKDAGVILTALKHIRDQLQTAVLVVHHTSKAGEWERGHTSYRGSMDNMYRIAPIGNGGLYAFTHSKAKDMAPFQDMTFSLIEKRESVVPFWHEAVQRTENGYEEGIGKIVELLTQYAGKRFPAKGIADAIGRKPSDATKLLGKAVKGHGVMRELRYPDRDNSSTNPWLYYIPAQEAVAVQAEWKPDSGEVHKPDGLDW